MLSKAWACAMAVLLCGALWADDRKPSDDDSTVIVIEKEDIEAIEREAQEISRDVIEALREALDEAHAEMDADRTRQHEDIRIEVRGRDEIREALREVMEESRGAFEEAGEAMRELVAQAAPAFTAAFAPSLVLADSGAGNSRPVDERKSAAGVREIEIENISGRITVIGWENDEIHVEGYIGEDVERLDFEIDDGEAEVRVRIPENRRRDLKIKSELTIHVPVRLSVEAQTVSGGVEARGLQGSRVDVETVSGGVKVNQCTGDIEASTTSGGITIEDAVQSVEAECVSGGITVKGTPTSVRAESVSGGVRIEGVQNEVEAESVSGRVTVNGGRLSRFSSESVSGGLDYEGSIAPGGRFDLNTLSGGIEITLTEDVGAEFNLNSFSGGINVDVPGAPSSAKKQLTFKTGDGSARVEVEAFSGGVRVKRK